MLSLKPNGTAGRKDNAIQVVEGGRLLDVSQSLVGPVREKRRRKGRRSRDRGAREEALRLQALCHDMLESVGEDPAREGLLKTPSRMAKALGYLTHGYRTDPAEVIGDALFTEGTRELVVVKGIEFYSLCEHHVLPFFGTAHVGYIPDGKIVGLSKVARLVEVFSRRLQVQERLTAQIAECMMEHLEPLGVAVIVEARHMCMMMRGVQKQNSTTVTSAMLGSFRDNPSTRSEFLDLVRGI